MFLNFMVFIININSVKFILLLFRWRKYRDVWHIDKTGKTDKFAAKNPSLLVYDETFNVYTSMIEEFDRMNPYVDVHCVRLV